ncbi:MAG TPA: CoB--CoM heterodisulfide reductase iron-sulfur subunit A family protein, partial [Chromatiales bacterium]|nr:CoB--CoM heterodisulfide reductase iron-sulfur subunit A family protein [Chromatiales bacterium]
MAEVKIGAYVCKGCGLGERLDTQALAAIATREGKAVFAKEHDVLCSQSGVEMIRKDIEAGEVNRVVLAACSRRAKTDAFHFDTVAVSRCNLREGVIWTQPDADEARELTQEMGEDYVRMSCAEVKQMTPPRPNEQAERNRHVLVVGGGISGLTAAVEASRAGYPATIVEKGDALGGWAAKLWRRVPTRAPYADPRETGVAELIAEVEADPNLTVYLNATVTRTSGAPGRFAADIATESGKTVTENFGAIVQASGFTPYDANRLPEFGYGKSPDVVDQLGLEKLARQADGGPIKRPSDGKEVQSVLFIQCAGQRS